MFSSKHMVTLSLSLYFTHTFTDTDLSSLYPLIWLRGQTDKQTDQQHLYLSAAVSLCDLIVFGFQTVGIKVVYSPAGTFESLYK